MNGKGDRDRSDPKKFREGYDRIFKNAGGREGSSGDAHNFTSVVRIDDLLPKPKDK